MLEALSSDAIGLRRRIDGGYETLGCLETTARRFAVIADVIAGRAT